MSLPSGATTGIPRLSRPASEPAPPEDTLASTARLALRVAGALTLAALLIALVTRLYFAAQARSWLGYPFTGIPAAPGVAAAIFTHNLRALLTVGGALLVAQMSHWARPVPKGIDRVLLIAVELALAAAVLGNLLMIGVSFGAYGPRMISATLPHGPFELASYSLALALYLQGRRRRLAVSHTAMIAAVDGHLAGARRGPRDLRERMRTRLLIIVLALAGGLTLAAIQLPRAFHELHALRYRPYPVPHAIAPSGAAGSRSLTASSSPAIERANGHERPRGAARSPWRLAVGA